MNEQNTSSELKPDEPKKGPKLEVKDLLVAFLVPLIIGKVAVLYFGINYSAYPDQGYGIGLVLSIIWTVGALARFLWRYRHYDDG